MIFIHHKRRLRFRTPLNVLNYADRRFHWISISNGVAINVAKVKEVPLEQRVEARTREIGRLVWTKLHRRQPSMFERRWWDDRILGVAMADETVKVQMFRF